MSENLLDLEFESSDLGIVTVRDFFKELLRTLWREGEGFSGKRPFGNSGWAGDLYVVLIKAGHIQGQLDEEGYLDKVDYKTADKFIVEQVIDKL